MPRLLAFSPLLLLVIALYAQVAAAQTTTATPLLFTNRDNDVADQFKGDLWAGTGATFTLEYHVKFARLTGDDEVKDGEVKFVLPDGTEYRVWVGLGDDNVLLRVYSNGQVVKEWEIERQSCSLGGCNEVRGTVNVQVLVECDGTAKLTVHGYTVVMTTLDPNDLIKVYVDNDASVTDTDTLACQPPSGSATTTAPPPGADPLVQDIQGNPDYTLYLIGAGVATGLLLAVLLFRRK